MTKFVLPLMFLGVFAMTGCGSSTPVVVDEQAIQAQIAKVEAEESVNRQREEKVAKQQVPASTNAVTETSSGAEGSN